MIFFKTLNGRDWSIRILLLIVLFVILYFPLAFIVYFSFSEGALIIPQKLESLSLRWYYEVLQDSVLWDRAKTSLVVGGYTALFSVILGTIIATYLEGAHNQRSIQSHGTVKAYQGYLSWISYYPMIVPDTIMGLTGLFMVSSLKNLFKIQSFDFWGIVFIHTVVGTAFAAALIRARLATLDRLQIESAYDLGARRFQAFIGITLPMIVPSLISAAVIAFFLSFDDVMMVEFLAEANKATLSSEISISLRRGGKTSLLALATLIMLTWFVLAIFALLLRLLWTKVLLANRFKTLST